REAIARHPRVATRWPSGHATDCRPALDPAGVVGRGLGGPELLFDQVEAGVPKAGIDQVDTYQLPQFLWRFGPAGGQELEVARHEGVALLLVAAVHRQREQLPVGVRVDVPGR